MQCSSLRHVIPFQCPMDRRSEEAEDLEDERYEASRGVLAAHKAAGTKGKKSVKLLQDLFCCRM